jgi:hypothetical protein
MSRASKLRQPDVQEFHSRYQEVDGSRKLYDRDKMPDGLDPDVWHLALYFEQVGESNGVSVTGRPILYVELGHRIRSSNIKLANSGWVEIVQEMIDHFWNTSTDTAFAINSFCNIDTFTYHYEWITDSLARKKLVEEGIRVEQKIPDKKPNRSSVEDIRVRQIMFERHTEEELTDKMRRFQEAQ